MRSLFGSCALAKSIRDAPGAGLRPPSGLLATAASCWETAVSAGPAPASLPLRVLSHGASCACPLMFPHASRGGHAAAVDHWGSSNRAGSRPTAEHAACDGQSPPHELSSLPADSPRPHYSPRPLRSSQGGNLGSAAGKSCPRHSPCMRRNFSTCTSARSSSSDPSLRTGGHCSTGPTFLVVAALSPRTARGSHGDDDGCAKQRCGRGGGTVIGQFGGSVIILRSTATRA